MPSHLYMVDKNSYQPPNNQGFTLEHFYALFTTLQNNSESYPPYHCEETISYTLNNWIRPMVWVIVTFRA